MRKILLIVTCFWVSLSFNSDDAHAGMLDFLEKSVVTTYRTLDCLDYKNGQDCILRDKKKSKRRAIKRKYSRAYSVRAVYEHSQSNTTAKLTKPQRSIRDPRIRR